MATALSVSSFAGASLRAAVGSKANKQTTKAAIEFYGPDRAKWLGPLSEGSTPDYLTGEFPGEHSARSTAAAVAVTASSRPLVPNLSVTHAQS